MQWMSGPHRLSRRKRLAGQQFRVPNLCTAILLRKKVKQAGMDACMAAEQSSPRITMLQSSHYCSVWGSVPKLPACIRAGQKSAHHHCAEQPPQSRLPKFEEAALRTPLMQAADLLPLWPCSAQLIQPHQQAQTQMQAPPHAHMHNGFVGPGSPRLQPGSPHVGSPHLGSPLAAGPLQQHLQLQGAEQPSSPARSQSSRSSSGSQGTPQGEPVLGTLPSRKTTPWILPGLRSSRVRLCKSLQVRMLASSLSPAATAVACNSVCTCWSLGEFATPQGEAVLGHV